MKISVHQICHVLLLVSLLACEQAGMYYLKNRYQELGIVTTSFLLFVGIFLSYKNLSAREKLCWIVAPLLVSFFLICIPPLIFSLQFQTNALPGILASRRYAFILLAPAIYLLFRAGIKRDSIKRTIIVSLFITVSNYVLNYFTRDLEAIFLSNDHYTASLVVFDTWRGFRLKAPLYLIALFSFYSFLQYKNARTKIKTFSYLFTTILTTWLLYIYQSRTFLCALAFVVLALIVFLHSKRRSIILFSITPILLLLASFLFYYSMESFLHSQSIDWSVITRQKSLLIALQQIQKNILFGVGQASYFGIHYTDLFGKSFSPTDLGFIGVTFEYGLIGACLYLLF